MARKFTAVVGSPDYLLDSASTLVRPSAGVASVLPNGDPVWSASPGSGITAGLVLADVSPPIDFASGDWTFAFYLRKISSDGFVWPMFRAANYPGDGNPLWQISVNNTSSPIGITFTQYQNDGSSVYRSRATPNTVFGNGGTYPVHIRLPAGGQPDIYVSASLVNAAGAGPTGTPNPLTTQRFMQRFATSNHGASKPQFFNALLSVADMSDHIAAMNAT